MFIPLWLLVLAGFAFALLFAMAFRPRAGGEMIQSQQRDARVAPHAPAHRPTVLLDETALLAHPEIRAALTGGHKIEAIKRVRERTGLGLKEAKELVERLQSP